MPSIQCKSRSTIVSRGVELEYTGQRTWPGDDPSHVQHVLLIGPNPDSLGRLRSELVNLLYDFAKRSWVNLQRQSQEPHISFPASVNIQQPHTMID